MEKLILFNFLKKYNIFIKKIEKKIEKKFENILNFFKKYNYFSKIKNMLCIITMSIKNNIKEYLYVFEKNFNSNYFYLNYKNIFFKFKSIKIKNIPVLNFKNNYIFLLILFVLYIMFTSYYSNVIFYKYLYKYIFILIFLYLLLSTFLFLKKNYNFGKYTSETNRF